jgi:hypothetical protein
MPGIAESHFILSPDAWDLLADIDFLQARLAGSRAWERDMAGEGLRAEIAQACTALSLRAADLGLDALSGRLARLGRTVHDLAC